MANKQFNTPERYTLQELMQIPDFYDEVAWSENQALLSYIRKPEQYEKFFEYASLTKRHAAWNDPHTAEFVQISTEIIDSEAWEEVKEFFENPRCMQRLIDSISNADTNDEVFLRVSRLFDSYFDKQKQLLCNFLSHQNEKILQDFFSAISVTFIFRFIQRLITDSQEFSQEILRWFISHKVWWIIARCFSSDKNVASQENSLEIFRDFVTKSFSEKVLAKIDVEDMYTAILSVFSSNKMEHSSFSGFAIAALNCLLSVDQKNFSPTVIKDIICLLTDFHTILKQSAHKEVMIHILSVLDTVVKCDQTEWEFKIISDGILVTCVSLYRQYPKSTVLHSALNKLFLNILNIPKESLLKNLLSECSICDFIAQAAKLSLSNPTAITYGGHMYLLAKALIDLKDKEFMKPFLQTEVWQNFLQNEFKILAAHFTEYECGMPSKALRDQVKQRNIRSSVME